MELEKHKESRYRDGGISSGNCKCGRPWSASQVPGGRGIVYDRICPGCRKKTKDCDCELLSKKV